ncbi:MULTISPECIES: DUF305 domain-containing protein [Achromobacter]|uniref:DUF305 domain-containing protein n=1 Tax=Achromobacter TaxID=222 RepID=UPI00244BF59E|nr:DUF305 domain-containing protein [Achromobacter animicus]MDH0684782.1 DUF305 domain-containing protein [Achromobacter animicus]
MRYAKASDGRRANWLGALTAVLLSATIVAGPAKVSAQPVQPSENKPSTGSSSAGTNSSAAMRQSMTNMQKQMHAKELTGDQDLDFAAMMRVHHMGAMEMAELELKHGKDPEMKKMAREIIDAQKKEIQKFDSWLAAHKRR